jgi:choline dehydrogenase
VDLGYFTDPADLPRLVHGMQMADAALDHRALQKLSGGERISPRPSDAAGWAAFLLERCWTYHHPVGTCAMGPESDTGAVVDADCRVYGVDGLSVVDASVMPEIPSANTNLPTIAVAEHLAARRLSPRAG